MEVKVESTMTEEEAKALGWENRAAYNKHMASKAKKQQLFGTFLLCCFILNIIY